MRAIDADALQLAIVEEGQANKRKKYNIGDIWELTGAEIREVINSQPTIQPEITHEQAVEYLQSTGWMREHDLQMMLDGVHRLTAQPEIIRCKDCKWWDRYNDNNGYCMAAKSCTHTSHWDIQIRRTYDGDFYCAHAEPKEEYEEDEDE